MTEEDKENDKNIKILRTQHEDIQQKKDANYELLRNWNKVWLALFLQDEFQGKLRRYREAEHESRVAALEEEIARLEESMQSRSEGADNTVQNQTNQRKKFTALQKALQEEQLQMAHDITRNRFFLNTFASEYVIVAIGRYILPLLYGLLGAVFFVLRTLSRELQDLTYLPITEINYRLRIPTGALAGLTISWFVVGDSAGGGLGSGLSGFAASFLTGYNVELLFFLMDKIISQLTNKDSGSKPAPSQSQPASKDSDSEPSQSQPNK